MKRDIRLQIEGSLLERLLEQAMKRGAEFAEVQRTGSRTITVWTDRHGAAILTGLCKKYLLDCRITGQSSRSALSDTLRKRWTLVPALMLCALICALFLGRIWLVDIEFTGPCAYLGNAAELSALLDDCGVAPGMPASRIDAPLLQKQLIARAGNYSFIGVRRQGVRLLVEASPEVPSPELHALSGSGDLVADRSGVIESIHVYSGEAAVKPGDTVIPGSLLIRGAETIGKNTETGEDITTAVNASGEVIARCWYEGSADGEIESIQYVRSGESSTACDLKLLGYTLPLTESKTYASSEIETQILPVVGLFLPLEIERRIQYETCPVSQSVDPEQLETQLSGIAFAQARRNAAQENNHYEPASEWTETIINGNTLHIRAVYEIYTDIAVERDVQYRGG